MVESDKYHVILYAYISSDSRRRLQVFSAFSSVTLTVTHQHLASKHCQIPPEAQDNSGIHSPVCASDT